uniref:E1A binding protein p400 n=1 Tax=Loxodonta africana TaxID=9785 RepID=G3TWH5_LOXAF
ENQVQQRIAELRKEGLWSPRRLPKVQEAPRPRAHWDSLLEEMQWMATDFAQERRWKVAAAKKLVRTVARHHEDKKLREERGRKEEQDRLRRIAASTAREIEYFWSNIEQVVEIKLQVELEEKRKKALNLQRVSRRGKGSDFMTSQSVPFPTALRTTGMSGSLRTGPDLEVRSCHHSVCGLTGSDCRCAPKRQQPGGDHDVPSLEKLQEEGTCESQEGPSCLVALSGRLSALCQATAAVGRRLVALPCRWSWARHGEVTTEERPAVGMCRAVWDGGSVGESSPRAPQARHAWKHQGGEEKHLMTTVLVEDEDETIEEEEANEGMVDHQTELTNLAREAELPLLDLMKLYEGAFLPNFQWPQPKPDSEETSEEEGFLTVPDAHTGHTYNGWSRPARERPSSSVPACAAETALSFPFLLMGGDHEVLSFPFDGELPQQPPLLFTALFFVDVEDSPRDRESRKDLVLIDSLFIMDQFKAAERMSIGKPNTKDIAEVTAVAEAILPKGSARITTSVKYNTPSLLYGVLRDYQKIGLDWLAKLYRKRLNGILADEAGLGKTVQVIAFFAHLACNEGNWGPHLVVVRSCNILKWELELKRWCPGLKTLLYVGSHRELRAKRQEWTEPHSFNICITSYKRFFRGYHSFAKVRWRCLVIDEMQQVKNMTDRHWGAVFNLHSQQRLLLIDAPLHNTFLELWTMVHFLIPGVSRPYRNFPLKAPNDENQDYYHKVVIRLHRVTQPFILRRTKRDVEKQLTKKYEHVLKCRLSSRQKALYEDVILQPSTQEALKSGHFVSVLNVLVKLQRICNHPGLIEPRRPDSSYVAGSLQHWSASLALKALERDLWKVCAEP